jgi:PAS domain S-box-containing protein
VISWGDVARTLVEQSADIVTLVDVEGRVLQSSRGLGLLGYEPEARVGSSMFELVHPDDVGRVDEMFRVALANKGVTGPFELRVRHADGSWRWLESISNNLLDDPDVAALIVNTRDVTDRKLAEHALRQSEELFRLVVEHASDMITVLNPDGTLRYASPAHERVLGYHAATDQLLDLVHPDDVADVFGVIATAVQRDGPFGPYQYRIRHSNGGWVEVETTGNRVVADDGLQGFVLVTRDISERRREEERRGRVQFLSAIAIGEVDDGYSERALSVGLEVSSRYAVLTTPIEDDLGALSVEEQLSRRYQISDAIRRDGCVWGLLGALGVLVVPVGDKGRDVVDAAAADVADSLAKMRPDACPPLVAVGEPGEGLAGLRGSLEDAGRVLRLARRLGLHGPVWPEDVIVAELVTSSPPAAATLIRMLAPLVAEDERRRGDLVATLRTYLAEGLSIHRTAEQLFLHRNSVRSRLRRIEALLGVPVADAKLQLELALIARDAGAAPNAT